MPVDPCCESTSTRARAKGVGRCTVTFKRRLSVYDLSKADDCNPQRNGTMPATKHSSAAFLSRFSFRPFFLLLSLALLFVLSTKATRMLLAYPSSSSSSSSSEYPTLRARFRTRQNLECVPRYRLHRSTKNNYFLSIVYQCKIYIHKIHT